MALMVSLFDGPSSLVGDDASELPADPCFDPPLLPPMLSNDPWREMVRLSALEELAEEELAEDDPVPVLLLLPLQSDLSVLAALSAARGDCSGDVSAEPIRLGAIEAFLPANVFCFMPSVLIPALFSVDLLAVLAVLDEREMAVLSPAAVLPDLTEDGLVSSAPLAAALADGFPPPLAATQGATLALVLTAALVEAVVFLGEPDRLPCAMASAEAACEGI